MVRLKNRYLVIRISFSQNQIFTSLDPGLLAHTLKACVMQQYGDLGYGKILSSISIKYMNPWTGLGIVRVSRDFNKMLWVCISLIRNISGQECAIRVVHVSGLVLNLILIEGTIKKCQLKAVQLNRELILKQKENLGVEKTQELQSQALRLIKNIEQ